MAMSGVGIEQAFGPQQSSVLRAFIGEVMSSAGTEAAANLEKSQEGLKVIVQTMSDQQVEMKNVMERFEAEKKNMQTIVEQFQKDSGGMNGTMQEIQAKVSSLNLEEVDRKVGGLVANLQEAKGGAMETLREFYGSAKVDMDRRFGVVEEKFAGIDAIHNHAHDTVARIEMKIGQIENAIQSGSIGKGKGGGGGGYESLGLVDTRYVKLPGFPDANPSAGVFRKWWKELARYCTTRGQEWKAADVIFRVVRGYPNQIDASELAQFSRVCAARDDAEGGNHFQFGGFSELHDKSRDMFACLEHSLNGKCSEMVGSIMHKDGFELLRKLARKFDPISPQAAGHYKSQIFAFAGHPCANFAKTVERMHALEKLCCDMAENTGETMESVHEQKNLADEFFPTMDSSCQAEILALIP